MSIEQTYRNIIVEEFIQKQLQQGVAITSNALLGILQQLVSSRDLTIPQFKSANYYTVSRDPSSASRYMATFNAIRQDLRVMYREMANLTKTSTESLERWKTESGILEKKLIDVETRIENLLFLTQDIEGYLGVIAENFTDTSLIDFDNTTAYVDISQQSVRLGPTNTVPTRIFLNNLNPTTDVKFTLRSTSDFLSREDAIDSSIEYPFAQTSRSWWTNLTFSKIKPVTCELTVILNTENPVALSRITIDLLDSIEASSVYITPLLSIDNINFFQIPSNTFTQEVRKSATFLFSEVSAKYIKFLLTKKGPDISSSTTAFSYQFGFKEISFYAEGYDSTTSQVLITTPLSVIKADGNLLEFEKVTLEECARRETNTDIKYYITTSNDEEFEVTSGTNWLPISPINRSSALYPSVFSIGDIELIEYGDTEDALVDDEVVTISYDIEGLLEFINPADSFYLLSNNISGDVQQNAISASTKPRYKLANNNERILNYQIKNVDYTGSGGDAFIFNEDTLSIFRNIGTKGLDPTNPSHLVRDIQRGWRFEDPYYICVIEILNPEGMTLDVGDKPMIIDDTKYTNKIDNTILSGKYGDQTGIHTIKVHKTNWKYVAPNATTLSILKASDPLYPYNHKLLIEGYKYHSSYPATSEKIYSGVDLFAEIVMKKVSIFDIINNILPDNHTVFALDRDAPGTHDLGNSEPTRVIVIKVSDKNTDSQNERFVIRFYRINQLKKYLRLKMELSTKDDKITPMSYGYKIKVG